MVGVKANCGKVGFESYIFGGEGRVLEANVALNCSVPERCIKYASDWSYATTIIDDLHSFTSLNPVPNAQVCVYLTIHITKLQLQTTFPKPFYIPHSACIHQDLGR